MKITRILQVNIPYINTIVVHLILFTIAFLTANALYLSGTISFSKAEFVRYAIRYSPPYRHF